MKKLIGFCAVAIFLLSCQKEISFEDPNATPPGGGGGGGGTTTGTKLVRVGTREGADTSTVDFTYNTANKIIGYSIAGTSSGQAIDYNISYVRDAANIITKAIYKSSSLAQYGISEIVTNYTYDTPNARYKNGVTVITIPLLGTIRDSSVYQYDGSGKLSTLLNYSDVGTGYEPGYKNEHTYTGTNVATTKFYVFNDMTNGYDLEEAHSYEYDAKVNPLQFSADAVILGESSVYSIYYSANNISKTTFTIANPASTTVDATTYTYNTSNRPVKGVSGSSVSTYYYQ